MAGILVNRQDLERMTQVIAGLDVPEAPRALLWAIMAGISKAMGDAGPPVIVTIDPVPSLDEQFAAAFVADEPTAIAGAGRGVTVAINKVGR